MTANTNNERRLAESIDRLTNAVNRLDSDEGKQSAKSNRNWLIGLAVAAGPAWIGLYHVFVATK